jgi:hypothetical protein
MIDRRRFLQNAALSVAASSLLTPETALADTAPASVNPDPADRQAIALPAVYSLNGSWGFYSRPAESASVVTAPPTPGNGGWTQATVPGCWENEGQPGTLTGPVWYRRDTPLPPTLGSGIGGAFRLWWECDAVSYHCEGYVNGRLLRTHTGMWDGFAWEIPPDALTADRTLRFALSVEKPGGKKFPVRETMAGFLPYVWGTWGGPWQEMRLRVTGPCRLQSVWASGNAAGELEAEAEVSLLGIGAVVRFTLWNPAGQVVAGKEVPAAESGTVKAQLIAPQVQQWDPEKPALYLLTVEAFVGGRLSDVRTKRVGFRTVSLDKERILINGTPVFFRAPLSWGWYEEQRAPNPSPEVFRQELQRVRALGFNGMKLCLWIPPQAYFDIADEMGMLLWVELPMWLPEGTKFCREQTPGEYRRIVRQVGDHPSVILWTIGCEIGKGVDAGFLAELYKDVKDRTKSPLVRDNSGSAECYGGPLPESADFRDYHLYCDLPLARLTFDAFAPDWRERQPFLFGEFNDQDALRDLPGLIAKRGDAPWWATADKEKNPQGVRWEYGVTAQMDRMKEANLLGRVDDLRESSRQQALLARKHTLELTRSAPYTSGYVVTGLVDTPISTAGLFDDFGNARFTPEEFRPFNDDTVLFIEPDRRRAWTAGGDRPSYLDQYGVWSGETVRRHIGVSHFGKLTGPATATWSAARAGGGELTKGERAIRRLEAGDVAEAGLLEFTAPNVTRPERITLSASISLPGGRLARNIWSVWVYPKPTKATRRIGLYDPADHLSGFADAVGITPVPLTAADGKPTDNGATVPLIVATAWRSLMRGYVQAGGHLLLVQPGASAENTGDGLPAAPLPFFREAMRLFEPHPSSGGFPHERRTDFNYYGLAADAAFEIEKVRKVLGEDVVLDPVLTRVDARSFAVHAYTAAAKIGEGRILLTTLRPQGGLGDQPSGLKRNVTGAYLLRQWLDWLTV